MMNDTLSRALRAAALGSMMLALPATAQTLYVTGPDGEVQQVVDQPLQQYGPTTRTDTLWRIANEVRPDNGVTVYQVMQALFNANPHAFTSSNFNSLERNRVLTVPTRAVMAALPASEARSQAKQHDSAWQPPVLSGSGQAAAAGAAPADTATSAGGDLTELQQENAQLSAELATQAQQAAKVDQLRQELASTADEMAQMLEQNALLQQQLDTLSQELTLMQQALDEQQLLNHALEQELDRQRSQQPATQPVADAVVNEPLVATPPSFWADLLANPVKLTLLAIVPVGLLMVLLLLLLRRRSDSEADAVQTQLGDQEPRLAEEMPQEEAVDNGLLEPIASTEPSSAGIQLDSALKDEDILSLDELLKEQEQEQQRQQAGTAELADQVDMDTLLNAVEPEVGAPATVQVPPADEPFIDIDKLLEESELAAEADESPVALETDTMVAMNEAPMDEGGSAAKLDLARAYIEIEDTDSARALLKEVALEGGDSQRSEAQILLAQL
ncbi:FimV/HubP family polar landmark protein [Ferrimonas pelagia]|uniref:Pilus assembly protein FimV n=1 Tax=Ferrimonas pelagia TaxID=1177826 RepID=A0ABP9E8Y9_9GAMM